MVREQQIARLKAIRRAAMAAKVQAALDALTAAAGRRATATCST